MKSAGLFILKKVIFRIMNNIACWEIQEELMVLCKKPRVVHAYFKQMTHILNEYFLSNTLSCKFGNSALPLNNPDLDSTSWKQQVRNESSSCHDYII